MSSSLLGGSAAPGAHGPEREFLTILPIQWAFLDVCERYWMVGRVATTLPPQSIDL
jgi:hypothetical protein